MSKMGDSVQVTVRVPVEQVDALGRIAAEADRTVSAEIRRLIRRHVTEASDRIGQAGGASPTTA